MKLILAEVESSLEQSPKFLSHTYSMGSAQISAILGLTLCPTPLQLGVGLVEIPMVYTLVSFTVRWLWS